MEKCLEGVMNSNKLNYVNIRFLSEQELQPTRPPSEANRRG